LLVSVRPVTLALLETLAQLGALASPVEVLEGQEVAVALALCGVLVVVLII
jgi:hypothetical protein